MVSSPRRPARPAHLATHRPSHRTAALRTAHPHPHPHPHAPPARPAHPWLAAAGFELLEVVEHADTRKGERGELKEELLGLLPVLRADRLELAHDLVDLRFAHVVYGLQDAAARVRPLVTAPREGAGGAGFSRTHNRPAVQERARRPQ